MASKKDNKYYCSIGPVPKGKTLGEPEYCLETKQVRYYGKVAIDKKLLESIKKNVSNLIKEQLKLKKIHDDAKILVNEVKMIKIILSDQSAKPSKIKRAEDKKALLLKKRDNLIKRLQDQQELVESLEAYEEKKKKEEKKEEKKEKEKKEKKEKEKKEKEKKEKKEKEKKASGSKTSKKK